MAVNRGFGGVNGGLKAVEMGSNWVRRPRSRDAQSWRLDSILISVVTTGFAGEKTHRILSRRVRRVRRKSAEIPAELYLFVGKFSFYEIQH